MLAIENEYYSLKDILCLLMDMFGLSTPVFRQSDFQERYYFASHFFNILTNFTKFNDFIVRDTYQTPVRPPMHDWLCYANRTYNALVYGNANEEMEIENDILDSL